MDDELKEAIAAGKVRKARVDMDRSPTIDIEKTEELTEPRLVIFSRRSLRL